MKGIVKFFNRNKNFGFITSDEDGKDYFVHANDVEEFTLEDNDFVEFEVVQGERGPMATKVNKVE